MSPVHVCQQCMSLSLVRLSLSPVRLSLSLTCGVASQLHTSVSRRVRAGRSTNVRVDEHSVIVGVYR